MAVNSFTATQGTQSALLTDNTGGTAGTLIPVMKLDISALGTFTKTWDGNLQGGTLGSLLGVGAIPNLPGGTVNLATVQMSSGTLNVATISTLPNTPGGTINLATVQMSSGTLNVATISTLPNTPGGTINLATVQMSSGTLNVATISTLPNLPQGSINVTAGTFQMNPLPVVNTISHAGTSGTTGIGTLVAAAVFGAGTAGYITSFHIMAISGTIEMILAFGSVTNGNQVIAHGLFSPGAGIAKDIAYPHGYGTTNSPITYQILSGAGTASWDVNYFPHT